MKGKRVKYLAIQTYHDLHDLASMKDEVCEFKSYNIKVRHYRYLVCDVHEHIDEMY